MGTLLTSWNNFGYRAGCKRRSQSRIHVYAPARKGAVSSSSIGLAAAPGRKKF